jgi:membrane protease YdiL (CAAX protease family)
MLVAFLMPALASITMLLSSPSPAPTNHQWLQGIVHEITSLLLLAYVLSKNAQRWSDIGLTFQWLDIPKGLLLAIGGYSSYVVAASVLGLAFKLAKGSLPHAQSSEQVFGATVSVLFVCYTLLSPWFEELIVRGYLMTEITALTKSRAVAVVGSASLQAAYHLYYGWWTAASMFFLFLVFALYFAKSRRLLPIAIAHLTLDVVALAAR